MEFMNETLFEGKIEIGWERGQSHTWPTTVINSCGAKLYSGKSPSADDESSGIIAFKLFSMGAKMEASVVSCTYSQIGLISRKTVENTPSRFSMLVGAAANSSSFRNSMTSLFPFIWYEK